MNVLLTGGTGFIGSRLVTKLVSENHHVYVLTRNPKQYKDNEFVSYISYNYPIKRLPFIHAIVNLAGESIFGYWSEKKKKKIISSRIKTTDKLISIIMQMKTKPDVFVSGSAVGYYGFSEDNIFTENTTKPANDFLATVATKWEKSASIAEDLGIRTVYTRFGVVLDKKEGALPLMAMPFKLFIGGDIGTGRQWIPWIHIEDCVNLLLFVLNDNKINGPVNITAPNPQRNMEFTKSLSRTLKRPDLIRTPTLFMRTFLGDMSQLITKGQFVLPQKALDNGFHFSFPHLDDALADIFK